MDIKSTVWGEGEAYKKLKSQVVNDNLIHSILFFKNNFRIINDSFAILLFIPQKGHQITHDPRSNLEAQPPIGLMGSPARCC